MESCLEAQQKLFSGEVKAPSQECSTEWSFAFVSNLQEQTEAEHSHLGNGKLRQPACGEQLATRTKVPSLALRKEKQQLEAAGSIAALAIAEGKKARKRGTPL